jgi:UDP-N-acetylmuramate--alanine ligase
VPELDLGHPMRIHVVGIGGAGMSAIATVLAAMGHTVTGSDRADSATLQRLARSGMAVAAGHDPARVAGAALLTASSAVPPDDPEVSEARRLGVPVADRASVLGAICSTRRTVAVAGTKGKTTTAAMIAAVLDRCGWRPSLLVGGDVAGLGGGARWVPDSDWLVVEADESDGTFLRLPADAVAVTNVEADHLEHYGSFEALEAAFDAFVRAVPGPRVVGIDTPASAALAAGVGGVSTFGTSPVADLQATSVRSGRDGASFECVERGRLLGPVRLAVPGVHNVRNACGAIALTAALGVPFADAVDALGAYRAVARRYEWRGWVGDVGMVDDYAHLPSALEAVIATARAGGWARVVAVFQPHLYSRTAALGAELGHALAGADVVVVTDVYGAREAPIAGVSGAVVADAAGRAGAEVHYVAERAALAGAVAALLRPGDVCLSLGAGDITTLAEELGAR